MKMRDVLVGLILLGSSALYAQGKYGATTADSVKCWENYNIFGSLIQTKNYTDAYEYWDYVFTNCPGAQKNTFIYAPRVLEAKIKAASSDEEKSVYIDQLISSYDVRLKYFPGKEGYVIGEKASKTLKYKKDHESAYRDFTLAYETNFGQMTPAQINGYFLSTVKMFNDKKIELDKLIHVYLRTNEAIAQNRINMTKKINEFNANIDSGEELSKKDKKSLSIAEKSLSAYHTVESNIEKAIGPLLSCENLSLLVNQETFDANKTNKKWLGRAAKMLQKERKNEEGESEDCTDNPMFTPIAEAIIDLEPSPSGYRALGIIYFKKKNYSKALDNYKLAAGMEQDPDALAVDNLKIAACYKILGNLSSAKTYALKAASLKGGWGDPYIFLATVYADAAGQCGSNIVEKNGVYWAAIDKCNKAKSVDPGSSRQADRLISAYKKAIPQKSVAFALNYTEGNKVTLGCWINETVTVKFYQ